MPFLKISAVLTVHMDDAPHVCEALNTTIDQLVTRKIAVFDSNVSEECVDPPEGADDPKDTIGG